MKKNAMDSLYADYRRRYGKEEIVYGCGNLDAELLMIGEAPGKEEVKLGKPFVGSAGKNLSEFLSLMNLQRESIYITNAIKYRLSAVSPKTGRVINRPAKREEILLNRNYLLDEIDIIRPKLIVTLGNVPLQAVTGDLNAVIGRVHGQAMSITLGGITYMLFPLYHPASIIYNRSLSIIYKEDIMKLKSLFSSEKDGPGIVEKLNELA